jgi:hypothetical protein
MYSRDIIKKRTDRDAIYTTNLCQLEFIELDECPKMIQVGGDPYFPLKRLCGAI